MKDPFSNLLGQSNLANPVNWSSDKLDTRDIEGARPDPFKKIKNIQGLDYMNVQDIPGARPRYIEKRNKILFGNKINNVLRVDDINLSKAKFTERRTTSHNPLEPVYSLPTKESGTLQIVGPIESSKPYLKHTHSPNREIDS